MADNDPKPIQTRRDLEARIVARAWREPSYKQRLLKDPKGVLQEELQNIDPNIQLPPGLKVAVHEEAANQYHLVLPRNPKEITLGDVAGDDLEALAPQTIAVVVVGLGVVVGNTVGLVNNVGNTNVGANVNVAANVNAAATQTSVG
ncbi:MAG TPA: NHLP leader peptide family RiPP precursor [Thermoanaerobaculia bacterium]|nr:NHLP leader peptide family RiPP precursor [Thermoanaerobaculia bacterium]